MFYQLAPPFRRRPAHKQMSVLCLGLSRSGTDSLRATLLILGYQDVYHGFVITAEQREDCAFWVLLMRLKFDSTGTENNKFVGSDSVLRNCEAVTDGPANVFSEELLSFNPHAKVILEPTPQRRRLV